VGSSVRGLGLRACFGGLGSTVQDTGAWFRGSILVEGLRFGIWGAGFRDLGSGCKVSGFEFHISCYKSTCVWLWGWILVGGLFEVRDVGVGVQGSGTRVPIAGFQVSRKKPCTRL